MGGSPVASRSWVKAHSPYWSLHVEAWRQSGMARGLLPPARTVDQDVRTLDEASDQQGRSPRTGEIPAGFASARAPPAAREEWQEVSETALFRAHGHPLACAPSVLGDACGSHELGRDGCSRIRLRPAAFALRVAQMAGPYRERRG